MNVTGPFVLKPDIVIVPCSELSEDVRSRITFDEGDFTLSHRQGRAPVQVIDAEAAALLELFRQPCTIVDAVIENSRVVGKDPHSRLSDLLPSFAMLVDNRVLVPAGSKDEDEIRPQLESGEVLAGWEIVRCVSLVEDSEVYQVRRGSDLAALKIARLDTSELRSILAREIAVLRHLADAGIAPSLIEEGLHRARPYAIMEWLPGVDAGVAASQRRHDRASLIDLCAAIASAYATLHGRGVLHGDVHARNVIAGEKVTLIDFGYAAFTSRPHRRGRAGVYYAYEPELCAARRKGGSLPPTEAGEQYSIAVLLYFLIAGQHYLDFRYDRDEMRRQVESDPPLTFAQRGVPPWPEVEEILFRALEKDPARRHASVAEMAELLANVRDTTARESLATPLRPETQALFERALHSFSRGGSMFEARYGAPTASIHFGCAGAAIGLLRIAETRGDPALLALANVWSTRALALVGTDGAYSNEEGGPTADAVGQVTPYHTESGVHAAAALVAAAGGDPRTHRRAIRAFVESSSRPCANLDLTLGRSGSLLGAALLLETTDEAREAAALRRFGAATMAAIWAELDERPPIPESPKDTYLGIAHGWAGFLYAALRWSAASGDALPARLLDRLHEFTELKSAKGRGVYWRAVIDRPTDGTVPSWCNGTAGEVFLFTLASRVLGDPEWLGLAEQCAWNTWDEPRASVHLCCGTAGRAYALLNLYKATGARPWLSRARQLANASAAKPAPASRRPTLWRGELGIAVLIADLESPENARMPFFE